MTAIASQTAPSLEQLAPHITPRVKQGDLSKAQILLLLVGALLIGGAAAKGWSDGHFFFSYLVGYMGVLGICLGALVFVMIQHITRAGWSVVLRRIAENIAGTLPFMVLLFLPIVFGFGKPLYEHWATHVDPNDHVLAGKAGFLNSTFFFVRVAIYFTVWIALALFFRGSSLKQDLTGDPAISLRMSRLAAPGILLFALSITFAAFDWIMSLDPHWFSTIFGLTYFAGGYMGFFAFVILLAKWLGTKGYLKDAISVEHYHDLGKLMFAFMVFWTYTNFSQYMLIWYANLPEETHWFAVRKENGWGAIGMLLIFGHFFVPFAFLMSRHVKRNGIALCAGAFFMLVMHALDMQFLILPAAGGHGEAAAHGEAAVHGAEGGHAAAEHSADFSGQLGDYFANVHWAEAFGCFFGVLAIVASLTIWNIRRANLLPVRDPRLAESLHFTNI